MSSTQSNRSTFRKAGIMSVLFQNGVGETSGSLFGSSRPNDDFTKDPERPKALEVNQRKDYAVKNQRVDSHDVDDGSLPCTPQSDSDSDSWSAENEALTTDTRQLTSQFLAEHTGLRNARWNESKALTTMKRVVGGLLEKHRYTYNGTLFVFFVLGGVRYVCVCVCDVSGRHTKAKRLLASR